MSTTLIPYNATTPNGRAIDHLFSKSALADIHEGIEVRKLDELGGRSVLIHPQFAAWCSKGEAVLLLLVGSFAGKSPVILGFALEDIDERSQRAVAEAVFIASGLEATTIVKVPA